MSLWISNSCEHYSYLTNYKENSEVDEVFQNEVWNKFYRKNALYTNICSVSTPVVNLNG